MPLVGNRPQGLRGTFNAGEKVAVEVDGPHHFTANGQKPLGEMCARHRLLDMRGWSVLSVPYFVWTKHADDAAHIVFLRQVSVCARHRLLQLCVPASAVCCRQSVLMQQSE